MDPLPYQPFLISSRLVYVRCCSFFLISLLDAEDPDQPSENVTQSNSAQSESQLLAHISHNVLLGNLTGPQLSESDGEQFSETSLTIATRTYLPA